jgi:hypothetical protein
MSISQISVVVPAYNLEKYIAEALFSLEHQSFTDFEVLVVDDGSTDNTPEIVKAFCDRDSRFKLLQKPNGGLSEVGEFDETLRSCEDVDFWLRIAATKKWQFQREPKVQCFYRVRPSGLSFDVQEMKVSQLRVIIAACKRSPELVESLLPTAYAYMNRYLARLSLTAGDAQSARKFIERALASDPMIFLQDPRSLLTLISVYLAPLSQLAIRRSLGTVKSQIASL